MQVLVALLLSWLPVQPVQVRIFEVMPLDDHTVVLGNLHGDRPVIGGLYTIVDARGYVAAARVTGERRNIVTYDDWTFAGGDVAELRGQAPTGFATAVGPFPGPLTSARLLAPLPRRTLTFRTVQPGERVRTRSIDLDGDGRADLEEWTRLCHSPDGDWCVELRSRDTGVWRLVDSYAW